MDRRVAVRGIIERDGTLLCVQLKPYKGSVVLEEPYWCTPGGGVDIGEPLIPALEREIVEELGVKPIVGNLLYIQQFIINNKEQMEFFFHIQNTQDFININLAGTTHGVIEIEQLAFVDPKAERVLPEFLQAVSLNEDIAKQQPPQFFYYS